MFCQSWTWTGVRELRLRTRTLEHALCLAITESYAFAIQLAALNYANSPVGTHDVEDALYDAANNISSQCYYARY